MNKNLMREAFGPVKPHRRHRPGTYCRDKFTFPMHYWRYAWQRRLGELKGAYVKTISRPDVFMITQRF